MNAIILEACITSIRAKVDKSISFAVATPELSNLEKAAFFDLQNINVQMIIEPTDEKVPALKIDREFESKTPSERMRNVLYRIFEQDNEGHAEFNTYYKAKMEKLIEHLKGKIE